MYEDSIKGKKEQPFMKKNTLRCECCQRDLSSFEDTFQLKTQSFSILVVWRFDKIFMLLKSFEVWSLYYLPVYEIINAN